MEKEDESRSPALSMEQLNVVAYGMDALVLVLVIMLTGELSVLEGVLIVLRKFLRLFFHGVTRVGANNLIIQATGFVEATLLKHPSNEIRVLQPRLDKNICIGAHWLPSKMLDGRFMTLMYINSSAIMVLIDRHK
jgi:hypothetical protein